MADKFKSEPISGIPGGARRRSTLVDRREIPSIEARERIAAMLRGHDFDSADRSLKEIGELDYATVRAIAQEGAVSNLEPAIRYNAIAVLGRRPPKENLNLLSELAQFGEDFYVRGHALLALGATGLHMALPIIAQRIDASDRFERQAAERATAKLVRRSGPAAVRAQLSLIDDAKRRRRVQELIALAEKGEPVSTGKRQDTRPRKRQ